MHTDPTAQPEQGPTDTASKVTDSIRTVRDLLAAGIITPESLGLAPSGAPGAVPTSGLVPGAPIRIRELAAKTRALLPENTRRTYSPYYDVLVDGWHPADPAAPGFAGYGDRWAHELLPTDLETALRFVRQRALEGSAARAQARQDKGRVQRRSKGHGAVENAVAAWRRMYRVAVNDRHLDSRYDPSQQVQKPRRSRSTRRALDQTKLDQLFEVVDNGGDDPELDRLICVTFIVTGARREGLLNLDLAGLDEEECTVHLDEKFDKETDQPVPDWLVAELRDFARRRGARLPADKVFRYRPAGTEPGRPITSRRLDYLFQRIQKALVWADREQVSSHTMRHHAITVVERAAGKAVSQAFARHEPGDVSDGYTKASFAEVAAAVIAVHGGNHPKVLRNPDGSTQPVDGA